MWKRASLSRSHRVDERGFMMKAIPLFVAGWMALISAAPAVETPAAASLSHFCQRLREKTADYRTSGSVVIVAFGDSITMGATANGVFEPEAVYHNVFKGLLEERFKRVTFSVVNSGIGGDSAARSLKRIDRDVVRYQPDLVIVAFGANDLGASPVAAKLYEDSLRQIIKLIRDQTPADIVLLTPSFMASRDNGKIPESQQAQLQSLMRHQNEGVVKQFADIVKAVAVSENVAVGDVYARWEELAKGGTDTTAMLANGLNHPDAKAQQIPANVLMELVTSAWQSAGSKD